MDDNLRVAVVKFLNAFEKVFDEDWGYTKEKLGIIDETEKQAENLRNAGLETIHTVAPNGTFLDPKVDDETEDWGFRGELLAEYRKLKKLL